VGVPRTTLENLETGSEAKGLEIVKGRPQKDKMESVPTATPVCYVSPFVRGLAVDAAADQIRSARPEFGSTSVWPRREGEQG
jgi:hypothetical protein